MTPFTRHLHDLVLSQKNVAAPKDVARQLLTYVILMSNSQWQSRSDVDKLKGFSENILDLLVWDPDQTPGDERQKAIGLRVIASLAPYLYDEPDALVRSDLQKTFIRLMASFAETEGSMSAVVSQLFTQAVEKLLAALTAKPGAN